MAFVYFMANEDSDIKVALDCETEVTSTLTNTATKSSIMSGASVSDCFIEGNEILKVSGVVSYTKTTSQDSNPTPAEYRSYIEAAIKSKNRFSVYFNNLEGSMLDTVDNCIITSRSYTVDRYTDTLTVSLTFESQFVTDAATTTTLDPEVVSDSAADYAKEKTKTGTTTAVTTSQSETYFNYLVGS